MGRVILYVHEVLTHFIYSKLIYLMRQYSLDIQYRNMAKCVPPPPITTKEHFTPVRIGLIYIMGITTVIKCNANKQFCKAAQYIKMD